MIIPRTTLAALTLSAVAHSALLVLPALSGGAGERPQNFIFVKLEQNAPAYTADRPGEKKAVATPPGEARAESGESGASEAVSSQELLSDPDTAKIFSVYFQTVKTRIQQVAERHRRYVVRDEGKIQIDFILRRDGRIAALEAHPDKRAAGDPLLVSRALDIIRSSQPFGEFPRDVHAEAVSFNITLVFDG